RIGAGGLESECDGAAGDAGGHDRAERSVEESDDGSTCSRTADRRDPARPALFPSRDAPERPGERRSTALDPVRYQGRGFRTMDAPLHRADSPQLVRALCGDVA